MITDEWKKEAFNKKLEKINEQVRKRISVAKGIMYSINNNEGCHKRHDVKKEHCNGHNTRARRCLLTNMETAEEIEFEQMKDAVAYLGVSYSYAFKLAHGQKYSKKWMLELL